MIKALSGMFCFTALLRAAPAMAAVRGTGSMADPVTGIAEPGDRIPAESHVINLSETDGTRIYVQGAYMPREYTVVFDAAGGSFADGTERKEIPETYNTAVCLPGAVLKPGCVFAAWYLKGNRKPEEPSEADGSLLSGETTFLLAADDDSDMAGAETDDTGKPVVKALWRKNTVPLNETYAADDPVPSDADDIWSPDHTNNMVIEWIPELPEKADYRKKHGITRYQYGKALLTAETEGASSYRWYMRKKGEESYTRLAEIGPQLLLEDVTREEDGASYRCEISVGEEAQLGLETELTVFWLPEPQGITISMDGGEPYAYG